MNETHALAVRPVTLDDWRTIEAIAPTMHQSRLFGVSTPQQAAAIMLKGLELGLGLAASFELIHIIEGKPSLSPRGALALIHRSGELADMKVTEQSNSCIVTMKRRSGFEYAVTWTMQDATRAGVVKPGGGWSTYPANMLRWRAIGFCADVVFPDVLGGLKRSDELGADLDEQGNVVEGQLVTTSEPAMPEIAPTPAVTTLDDLVQQFGAEAVMTAAGGRIPATLNDVATVASVLVEATAS